MMLANRDLAPEIKAMIKRTIMDCWRASHSEIGRRVGRFWTFAKHNLVPEDTFLQAYWRKIWQGSYRLLDARAEKSMLASSEIAWRRVCARIPKKCPSCGGQQVDETISVLWINCGNAVGLPWVCANNPVVEYQSESFRMFNDMIGSIEFDVTRLMMKAQIHGGTRTSHYRTQHFNNCDSQHCSATTKIFQQILTCHQVKRNDLCHLWFQVKIQLSRT